jgi:NAD(P)-dependent dehydrogenase (short-subunit alcohol dehydrogenase family)
VPPRTQAILVTGCSTGIGRATAVEASKRGHRVLATARNAASLAGLDTLPGISLADLDVTDPVSVAGAVRAAVEAMGRLDAVVNNAGVAHYGAVEEVPPASWREQFAVNVFGAIEIVRAALPFLRQAGGGTIVNVSSVAGRIAIPFAAPYCSSKHALEAISDCLRLEVEGFGVRVVVVEPGPIETAYAKKARATVQPLLDKRGPYSEIYVHAERAMDGEFQAGRLPPEAVARVILDAIESPRPKTRYRITRMAKTLIPLKRVLTDRALDRQMRRALGVKPPRRRRS